jgi:hypothetical protein
VATILLVGGLVLHSSHSSWASENTTFSIATDYPGGNILVERIDGNTVHLLPDLRDTEGWWFYWNFKVSGASGQTLTFRFSGRDPIGVRGPAISIDDGATWSWLGADKVKGASFSYFFPGDSGDVRFAFTVPYQESDLRGFLATRKRSSALAVEKLCTSAKGRRVEVLRSGCLDSAPRHRVLLTARHHACETMASFALEGLLAAVLAENDDGPWFQHNVEVLAVPFVDKDGVEDGDQGKNRRPHDHNRDYNDTSIYPEVAALRAKVQDWSNGKLRVALDLHCPYIRGGHNEDIYIVGSADPAIWEQQQAFGEILEAVNKSPLPYQMSSNLPYGESWNTSANYTKGKSFGKWAGTLEGIGLATTLELPYANAGGEAVTPESARAFGRSLAKAIRAYLESLETAQ